MSDDELTLSLIRAIRGGDQTAMETAWRQLYPKLLAMIRRRFDASKSVDDDEEDIALSALESFFRGLRDGRFPELTSQNEVWRLLSKMTQRKIVDRIRRGWAKKNGDKEVVLNDPLLADEDIRAASPELEAIARDQVEQLLLHLREKDEKLEALAIAKMAGYTNEELAEQFERSIPTIERWLSRIRKIGQRLFDG